MSGREHQVLRSILAAAGQQLDLLIDGLGRPDWDQASARRHAFDMTLKAMAAEVRGLLDGGELDASARASLQAFADKAATLAQGSVDVHNHLIELSQGWECKQCGADVVKQAAVSGVRAETYQVELVCAACGERSPLTGPGHKLFTKLFGARLTPTWNPRANGFLWNES